MAYTASIMVYTTSIDVTMELYTIIIVNAYRLSFIRLSFVKDNGTY
jgi:hypothetical protein